MLGKIKLSHFALVAISLVSLHSKATDSGSASDLQWRENMRTAKTIISELLPDLVDEAKFSDIKNRARIEKNINRLTDVSNLISHGLEKNFSQTDPTVQIVSHYFADNLKNAKRGFEQQRYDYSRFLLMNTMSYCIECHTRTQSGVSFDGFQLSKQLDTLDVIQKIEYFISARQYEAALKLIEETLQSEAKLPMFGGEKILRYGLGVTVKFLNDPDKTLALLSIPDKANHLPYFLRDDLKQWKKSAQDWKKENRNTSGQTLASKVTQAEGLIKKANALNVKLASSNAGHIETLRANAILTLAFQGKPDHKVAAKMFYLTGQTYEMIPDHLFWTMHESFYSACVNQLPHSEQAMQCYRSFEESVVLGYSGSSGTRIPPDVMEELTALRKTAEKASADKKQDMK